MATNFGLTTSTPPTNVIQSINYLLATVGTINSSANVNLGNVVQVSSNNAIFSNVGIIGYVNAYMDIKYANSATGSSGFSSNSTMANYYGVYNSATNSESTNPVDYQWTQVVGGFGTSKGLYYTTGGGNTISFYVGSAAPNTYYQPVPDNVPIVLASISKNLVTTTSIQANAVTNVQIATGTITTDKLAANSIFVGQSLQSTGATFGDNNSAGFWLAANTGNARFGGNVSIGNNLYVTGLVTAGNLQANTVATTNLVLQTVSLGNGVSSSTQQVISSVIANQIYTYTYAQPIITTTVVNQGVYINGNYSMIVNFAPSSGTLYQMFGYIENETLGYSVGGPIQCWYFNTYNAGNSNFAFNANFTGYDIPQAYVGGPPGTYKYSMKFVIVPGATSGVNSLTFLSGNMVLQGLKR